MFVGHKRDASTREIDRIDRVQELRLRCRLVGEEVDVVDREKIDATKTLAELLERTIADGGDVFVRELLGGDVADDLPGCELGAAAADPLKKVGFADATLTVEENDARGFRGTLRELFTCGKRQAVGVADDLILNPTKRDRSRTAGCG